ncbi:MAG TPA: PQQ-binding-like beta-propeller repeat protein [Pyrinomonadaceae bacterium]|jgi:outer membrane protein assembly factor BamB
MLERYSQLVRLASLAALLLAFTPAITPSQNTQQAAQQTQNKKEPAQSSNTSLHLRWSPLPEVLRYRLQLARDEQFVDIVFDRAVYGSEYVVNGLAPGRYYWHVAPAVKETGKYSKPLLIVIPEDAPATAQAASPTTTPRTTGAAAVTQPQGSNTGWRTTTGLIAQPLAAHLRTTSSFDLVGVNADGMVYALEGGSGVPLWIARFRPNAQRGEATGNGGAAPFTPLLVEGRNGLQNVVVAFEGGLRALDGATGRELWRAALAGRVASGAFINAGGDNPKALVIATSESPSLTVLDAESGKTLSQTKLDAAVVGAPVAFAPTEPGGVIVALEGGVLETHSRSGERLRTVKMDTTITTQPLVVTGPRGMLVLIGTENGLISLDSTNLHPLGRIATEDDAPRGVLTAADLDGDGAPEVIMLTRRARVVAINTTDGKIRWFKDGATDATSAAFADLDGDGALDVLVPAGTAFAIGFSGRDGAQLWREEEGATTDSPGSAAVSRARALLTAQLGNGPGTYVIGSDPLRIGMRAIELPKARAGAAR